MADRRDIPSIDTMLRRSSVAALVARHGRRMVVDALRAGAERVRVEAADGKPPADLSAAVEEAAHGILGQNTAPSLRLVINATGVIIHTNLGRAPLSREAADRVAEIATAYSNLEYDIGTGRRGRRDAHAERFISLLTTAEAACVVNNNAAATLLALAALAAGREVIVSRGELVEIGGGFRVPEVMTQSGALLREVGTTNRTRASDYAAAISDRTALLLRVHPSNFRVEGFTERPALGELVELGDRFGIPVVEDVGSGYIGATRLPLGDEPVVRDSIRAGAAVVMFSGDKLLGGPQAGIIAGRAAQLEPIRRHPLMRALRADKMVYAALEATLEAYVRERVSDVPVIRMIDASVEDIDARARHIADSIATPALSCAVIDGASTIGGGSVPGSILPTRLLQLHHQTLTANELEARLRDFEPPVVARIQDDRLVLDLRTVFPAQDGHIVRLLATLD